MGAGQITVGKDHPSVCLERELNLLCRNLSSQTERDDTAYGSACDQVEVRRKRRSKLLLNCS